MTLGSHGSKRAMSTGDSEPGGQHTPPQVAHEKGSSGADQQQGSEEERISISESISCHVMLYYTISNICSCFSVLSYNDALIVFLFLIFLLRSLHCRKWTAIKKCSL